MRGLVTGLRGSLTDSACRLGGFGLSNTAVLTKCGPYPHRSTPPAPDFDVPYYDLGGGIACADYRFGAGAQPTHTRASTAWTRLSSGLWVEVPAGYLRSYYNEGGEYLGALFEQASNNRCLWNRDLTNAVWTAAGSPTIAKDGTGMDGVANSCSTMICGAAGDTVMQTYVHATTNNRQNAFWLKRLIGTGTVEITSDGVTWEDITSQLSASHFRFITHATIPSLQTVWLGIRMTTPGDQIAVDMGLISSANLNGSYPCIETPIPTGALAVARQADRLGNYDAANVINSEGTCYAELSTLWSYTGGFTRQIIATNDGIGAGAIMQVNANALASRVRIADGTSGIASVNTSYSMLETSRSCATSWGASSGLMYASFMGVIASTTFDGSCGSGTGVYISRGGIQAEMRGCIKNLKIWKKQLDINVMAAVVNRGGR